MRRVLLLLFSLCGAPAFTGEIDRAFWVWHRYTPLAAEEIAELQKQGVRTLFWNAGTMEQRGDAWRWKAAPIDPRMLAGDRHAVPVVRLDSPGTFAPPALAALLAKLRPLATAEGELQLDFDCPDRLLTKYAAALAEMRREIPRLSITALAHWPRLADFAALEAAMGEFAPMFYDLQADPTGISAAAPPPPLLDPAQIAAALRDWSRCRTPWRAGLPSFARLTVFDRAGHSRGQIPNWSWDDFCFDKHLHSLAPTHLGRTLLRADADTRVARTPVRAGEFVVSRATDRATLARAVTLAAEAGAAGIVFFRLPDGTDPAGWSLSDLAQLASPGSPRLVLRRGEGDTLVLANDSPFDLAPRLAGGLHDRDRGHALEIDADGPVFREALAGAFWRVGAHTDPDAESPKPAPVPLATRLTFWFSHLRGGARLETGLFQLAPAAKLSALRYRVGGKNTPWKSIDSP